MCKVKKILGIAGWILLGAVVGGVVGNAIGSDGEELSVDTGGGDGIGYAGGCGDGDSG